MKKRLLMLVTGIILLASSSGFAQIDFGFTIGLSTPNNNINDVWNSNKMKFDSSDYLGNLYRDGSKFGYNLGIRLRMPLTSNIVFFGGLGYHRFPQTDMSMSYVGTIPNNPNDTVKLSTELKTTQTLIPISLGLDYYLFRSLIGLYLCGDLSYNYILNNVEYQGVPLKASMSPSDNRIGFGFGVGLDVDIKLLLLNLEVKYNNANLIGKVSNEQTKNYLMVNFGVFFGNSKKSAKKSDDEN